MNDQSRIAEAESEIDSGNVERAHQLLEPLVKAGDAKAIFLAGSIGKSGESEAQFLKRHIESVEIAAEKGDVDAIYALGIFYDVGDDGFEIDLVKASELFKKAADLGHLRCKWIHACELLWGLGSYDQDISKGLQYLKQSMQGNFVEAFETMARIYEHGEFGYEKSDARAAELRALAMANE